MHLSWHRWVVDRGHLRRAAAWSLLAWAGTSVLCTGCEDPGRIISQLRKQNQAMEKRVGQLERQAVALQEELKNRTAQVKVLQRLGVRRLDLLNVPVEIEIERLSGGYDEDGLSGDDGVVVYLRPKDAQGDVVKATGEVEIQLLDLANRPEEYLVGQYFLDAEHAREQWYGGFWTHHYTVKCPWRAEPPEHEEITVRVLFTDYVSGAVLTDQRVVRISLGLKSAS